MKSLHRPDLFAWSSFDRTRNVDFTGTFLVQESGNLAFDPMPVDDHDAAHIEALGGVAWVVISNADHVRAAGDFVSRWGAQVAAPAQDRGRSELEGVAVARWLTDGDTLLGVRCVGLRGSKTPEELAFVLPGSTVLCGDLVRGQRAGSLNLLPDPKLTDKAAALASVQRLADLEPTAVLVGDGQSVFRGGAERLHNLLAAAQG